MIDDRKQRTVSIAYDVWKLQLRKDCEVRGKLDAFDSLGEYALKLLWETGIDPTVAAIVGDGRRFREG
jgi:hypothetical protein